MVDRICVVLEALSIAVCLHRLYGKKFRFDIATVSLMTIEMIMMQAIDYFGWPKELSMLFYPIIAGYCVIEFGVDLKKLVINNILNAIIICILQMIVMMLFYIFSGKKVIIGIKLLFVYCIVLLVVTFLFPRLRIKYLVNLFVNKEKILIATFVVCIIILSFFLIDFKKINLFSHSDFIQYFLLFICIVFMGGLAIQLIQYKIKSKEVETELKMHMLYANSFDNLIDNIRLKQHEFDNHINTIYSQHYIYKTYEELVEAQKNYCQLVTTENHFNKLLGAGNPVIVGFLYGKFIEIDKLGINITYRINIKELHLEIPIYKLVEILGNLIGNAVDALMSNSKYNKLCVYMEERDGNLNIEVKNESDYINYEEIQLFFNKGYSIKGLNRGVGLFHVKNICDEYGLEISCQNKEEEKINWISFTITN